MIKHEFDATILKYYRMQDLIQIGIVLDQPETREYGQDANRLQSMQCCCHLD